MEHKLITGGEQYLPFARSRIKALRATGLRYASQQFEVDGASVKVRIVGEHEYIEISGGACTLLMDSGVVDLGGVVPWDAPSNYLPGILHETAHAKEYNAAFVAPEGAANSWRTDASKTSTGQLTGNVSASGGKPAKFSGKVPQDGVTAASFAREYKYDETATPPTWKQAEQDDMLWAKKLMAANCPPSIFTGKCRLYVQALYGAHNYNHKTDGAGKVLSGGEPREQIVFPASSVGLPYLKVSPYRETSDKTSYPLVALYTSTGIYLDPATGGHWMVNPAPTNAAIYPMRASACGESLRKYLMVGKHPELTADDREHLEAYILSSSRPHVKEAQSFFGLPEVDNYSMGYGWHWNWSGTCADIAINKTEALGMENGFLREGMVSTHYRLTVTPATSGGITTWDASISVVSGPGHWAVSRISWSVTEPDWVNMCGEATIPKYGTVRAGEGTFYVFYLRDELQRCTVEITKVPAITPQRTRSDSVYAGEAPGSTAGGATIGMLPGWYEDLSERGDYYSADFSCGGQRLVDARVGYVRNSVRMDSTGKSAGPIAPIATEYTGATGASLSIEYGYPDSDGGYASVRIDPIVDPVTNALIFAPYPQNYSGPYITFDKTSSSRVYESPSSVTIIIPLWDSEAVFFQGYREDITYSNDRVATPHASYNLASTSGFRFKEGGEAGVSGNWIMGDILTRYDWALGSSVGPSTGLDPSVSLEGTLSFTKLVCRAGSIDADMPSLAYFHGEDQTPIFGAVSGARIDTPIVISKDRIDPIGTDLVVFTSALVGWV